MRLNVFAKDMELTDAMEDALNSHLDKLGILEDFVGDSHLDVTFRVNKHNHVCEGQIRVNQKDHFVKSVTHDMYESIEEMVHDLKRQLQKTKDKAQDKKSLQTLDTDDTIDVLLDEDYLDEELSKLTDDTIDVLLDEDYLDEELSKLTDDPES